MEAKMAVLYNCDGEKFFFLVKRKNPSGGVDCVLETMEEASDDIFLAASPLLQDALFLGEGINK